MGTMKLLLCLAAVVVIACVDMSSAAGRCPPPSKIYDYPKRSDCRSDGDCRGGKICCPNPARILSCTISDPHGGSGSNSDRQTTGVVTCEGVKCQPYEVCKADPNNNKRKKCQRG